LEETIVKAVLMTAPGNPEVLQLQEVPNPGVPVGSTELLVRLVAAPLILNYASVALFTLSKCLPF